MDVSSLNTSLLDFREALRPSPFLQNMEKTNDVSENKVYSKSSFKQKYYGAKTFGLNYTQKSSKEIVTSSINAGFTPLDAIKMNKAMQSFSLESFTSKNGIELLSQHFHVI